MNERSGPSRAESATKSPTTLSPRRQVAFMKYRRFWVGVSLALLVGFAVWLLAGGRPRLGTELAGGTQLTLRFRESIGVDRLRAILDAAGFSADLQTLGPEEENTFLLSVPPMPESTQDADRRVQDALDAAIQPDIDRRRDLNRIGRDAVRLLVLEGAGAEALVAADTATDSVAALRRDQGVLRSWEELADRGVSETVVEALKDRAEIGAYAVLGVETISAQVGRELVGKGIAAVILALLAMLGYIAVRFELPFGIGASMASIHDVLVAMGFFVALGFEIDLTTVAALLTLVGYSVNDTVVVFDRLRENRKAMPRLELEKLIDRSVNDTLARTLTTSATTLCAAVPLLVFGGEALRGFSFILVTGVVVGTYSTIYIAGSFTLLWESVRKRRRSLRPPPEPRSGTTEDRGPELRRRTS